ncbi:Dihydroneopterin aldolase 1 [Ananas comosus]|uniref:dihydroneopterin aldolase n=1 Tax=Ananas comosus TaxID=4615 RepID=A0A199V4U2_ANACO|nr:Dihydroneopterin aldolase 1 [Ananas comosus]
MGGEEEWFDFNRMRFGDGWGERQKEWVLGMAERMGIGDGSKPPRPRTARPSAAHHRKFGTTPAARRSPSEPPTWPRTQSGFEFRRRTPTSSVPRISWSEAEEKAWSEFVVDTLSTAGKTDDLSDTVSYTDIYRIVREVVEGPSQNLLESVAHLIVNTTLLKFPQISAVRVKVGKPHVAVHGVIDHLGVEILRYKKHEKIEST